MEYAVIMAGGSGTRLWPLSRRGMPKQLLDLLGGRSLLQMAYDRAVAVIDPARILVCAGDAYRDVIRAQLPDLPPDNLLLEPVGRDSLAAAAWSAAVIARRDPAAVVAVLTADHVISPQSAFEAAVRKGLDIAGAADDVLVTFGVAPTHPHSGFGYIQARDAVDPAGTVFRVNRFVEKPAREVAEGFLAEGNWWWNSGMSCWRARVFLDLLRHFEPAMADGIEALAERPDLVGSVYPGLTRISIDYAILEPVAASAGPARLLAVALEADWADIGGYAALADQLGRGEDNAIEGRVVQLDSSGNLIVNRSGDRLIAVSGLKDMIVVQVGDVTLVCPFDHADSIRRLAELARAEGERYA